MAADKARALVARFVITTLALAVPALAFAQTVPQEEVAAVPPVQAVPGVGSVGAALPGAGVPGATATGTGPAPAELTHYGIAVGVGETDNVALSSTHPKSQTIAAANLDFDVRRSGSLLDASALGNFADLNYLQGAYGNQVLGRFDGLATAKLWSDRLKWMAAEDFGEQQIDPFAAIIPTELQRVNVFTTGPDLTLRPSYSTFITLDARYSQVSYQTSPFDSHNLSASAALGRQLSPLSSLSIVVQAEQLRFNNTLFNTNYSRREAYGRYRIQGARTSVEAQLGATQANDVNAWKTSPLVRLTLTRRVSPFSVVTLMGGREYTDSGGSFASLRGGAAGGIAVAAATQSTGNYLRNYGSAGWQFSRLRTTFGFTADWEHDGYDRQRLFDTTREDLALNLGRSLTPRLSVSLTGMVDRYDYLHQGYVNRFGMADATVTYRPGRWLVVYAQYEHTFSSTAGARTVLLGPTGYDENRIFIMIGYRPHSNTEPAGASGFGGMPGP
ncbi:MAG: hypothetical protein HIU85_12640 [Proteobacteria bacterium]|nr:hypothetical protein [Pseudomonadota bacterium]